MNTLLIILTSTNIQTGEYEAYWKKNNHEFKYKDKLLILNGLNQRGGYTNQVIAQFIENIDNLKYKDVFVCCHDAIGPRKTILEINEKKIQIFKYSTTNNLTDFWTYRGGFEWQIPNETPHLPFDFLCWAVNQEAINDNILDKAIESVKEYIIAIEDNKLAAKLNILHECLSPETINSITDEDINKLNQEENIAYYNFINEVKHIKDPDPFDNKYRSALITLRTSFLSKDY